MRNPTEKIISWTRAETLAFDLRNQKTKIVTTNGCFDILHLGHLNMLKDARLLGDRLWVGLNSDASVRGLKGSGRPIQDQHTRALQLAALEAVDYVTVFEQSNPEAFLAKVRPAIHVKGGDYKAQDLPERKVVEQAGGEVICLPFTEGFSTTALIEKLKRPGSV